MREVLVTLKSHVSPHISGEKKSRDKNKIILQPVQLGVPTLSQRGDDSGLDWVLIHLQTVLLLLPLLAGIPTQVLGLFQGGGQRLAQSLGQHQCQHPDDEGQDPHDQLFREDQAHDGREGKHDGQLLWSRAIFRSLILYIYI